MAEPGGVRHRHWLHEALSSDPYLFLHNRLSTFDSAPMRRITIRFDELDDIAQLELALPAGDRLIALEATRDGRLLLPVLTDIEEAVDADAAGPAHRDLLADGVVALGPSGGPAATMARAKLWSSLKWDQSMSPYLVADWSLRFAFLATDVQTALTLDIPYTYGPACLQGNHFLAHPSQREGPRRLVRLLFAPGEQIETNGRIAKTAAKPEVWTSLAKGAVLLCFGFVLSLIRSQDLAGQQAQLLLSALAGLGLFGATEMSLLEASVYLSGRRPLRLLQLASVVVSVGLFVWISADIVLNHRVSSAVRDVIGAVIVCQLVLAMAGAVLHRRGYWSGYECDISRERIGLRRGHKECFVTGRVPCQADIDRLCAQCPHFADLGMENLTTLERYDPALLPCATERVESRDTAAAPA